jgi:hypothetical protein
MARSKARRQRDREQKLAANAIVAEVKQKEKDNARASTTERRSNAGNVTSTTEPGD